LPPHRSTRVLYRSGDRVARSLAERLVALASGSSPGTDSLLGALLPGLSQAGQRATVAAMSSSAFAEALRAGDDLAYVLPLPIRVTAPCEEFATLRRAAPWLELAHFIPLLDTRSTVLIRRDRVGLKVDGDGTMHLLEGVTGKKGQP